jgi:hypothetical protein
MDKGAFSLGEIENGFEAKKAYLTQYLLPVPEVLRIFGSFQVSSCLQTMAYGQRFVTQTPLTDIRIRMIPENKASTPYTKHISIKLMFTRTHL